VQAQLQAQMTAIDWTEVGVWLVGLGSLVSVLTAILGAPPSVGSALRRFGMTDHGNLGLGRARQRGRPAEGA
jgi:hypothetical protein